LLLLLLLLKLLLELWWDGGHRWCSRLEALLRRRLPEAGELRLKLAGTLLLRHSCLLRLQTWKAGILLLQWSLSEAGRLRCEWARLLLLLLACAHAK
jgi:hypothetical protein